MAKKCIIYYATVIDSGNVGWAAHYSKLMEPVKVEEREPLGQNPEYCCPELEDEFKGFRVNFYYRLGAEHGICLRGSPSKVINFCPFCGAEIQFKAHLNLKVIETTRQAKAYHYESVVK